MKNNINMKELREQVKVLLEDYNLPTRRFGIAIVVNEEEFAWLADENPYMVHPDMLAFIETDEMGNQSYVQITKEHIPY